MLGIQVLPYDVLMHELDVVNVRELEDFLINECMYVVGGFLSLQCHVVIYMVLVT